MAPGIADSLKRGSRKARQTKNEPAAAPLPIAYCPLPSLGMRHRTFLVEAILPELAIERGTADAETAGDFAHVAGIMLDGQANDVALDGFQGSQVAGFIIKVEAARFQLCGFLED